MLAFSVSVWRCNALSGFVVLLECSAFPSDALAVASFETPVEARMKQTQMPPFLRPPAELRDHICSEALVADGKPFESTWTRHPPTLLSASHQIKHEASGLFYSYSILISNDPSASTRFLSRLARKMREPIAPIRLRRDLHQAIPVATGFPGPNRYGQRSQDGKAGSESCRAELSSCEMMCSRRG